MKQSIESGPAVVGPIPCTFILPSRRFSESDLHHLRTSATNSAVPLRAKSPPCGGLFAL